MNAARGAALLLGFVEGEGRTKTGVGCGSPGSYASCWADRFAQLLSRTPKLPAKGFIGCFIFLGASLWWVTSFSWEWVTDVLTETRCHPKLSAYTVSITMAIWVLNNSAEAVKQPSFDRAVGERRSLCFESKKAFDLLGCITYLPLII